MHSLNLIFTLAAIISIENANAARVLGLFPHTGRSHQMVYEPLLRRLAGRGHHVTVVSFFPLKNPPENYTDVSLVGIADIGIEVMDLSVTEQKNALVQMLGLQKIARQVLAYQSLNDMALGVCSKLVKWSPLEDALQKEYDVILTENFNSDCMLGLAHVYGQKAPIIALLSSTMTPWSADRLGVSDNPSHVPIVSSDYTSRMTFLERFQNTLLTYYYKLWFRYTIQLKEQEIIEKHFGRKIPDLKDLAKNTSLMLVNVFHSLNGVRPLVPGVVEVGGMHLNHDRAVIPPYMERFINESPDGVVIFSFGSLLRTSTMPPYKKKMISDALSGLKQRVIWKYEESGEEGTLEGNILKVKWLPQYELLRHKKVLAFVGHGGMLGMTEAISVGKPMVVVPYFADQFLNGVMAEEVGFGVAISYDDLTEESLAAALQKVLTAEMQHSARLASKLWHDRESKPLDTAVYWTERVIRWGSRDPLHAAAKDLNFIQYALLDVAVVLLFIILSIVFLLKCIVTLVIRSVTGNSSNKYEVKRKKH